jgi:HAD superfamily hydrolase (TIGR01509 family)
MPSLIIFDCDGVLVDSEGLVNEIEAALLSRWGWDVTPAELRERFKGRAFGEIAEIVRSTLGERLPTDWIYEWAMETAAGFHARLRPVPGVRELLQQLRAERVPLCVASQSSFARVRLSLALCRLSDFFAARIYTASMVLRPKPAPDLFLHAARALSAEPGACVVIEDSASGVLAGLAAGMRVLGFAPDQSSGELARPDS